MIGKTVSHYKILEKLGEGGMGVVYRAEDTKLKRTVALKFLPPEHTRDPEAKVRFIREAQAASSLEHSNICNIHEIDETEDGQMFIVMACYEGLTLKNKIKDKRLKTEESIDIAIQIAEGLAKAHEKGIVHRDIKPANILITNDVMVKILDFGLAKLGGQAQLTKDSSTLGTVAYMSPEQISGKEVDQRTDIWSLGVVFYEMLTGELPFSGDYEQAMIYAILNEEPKALESIPPELKNVVKKTLCKNPDERYINVAKLLNDLTGIRETHGFSKPLQQASQKTRKRAIIISAIAVLILIAAIAGIFFFPTSESEESIKSLAVLPFSNIGSDAETDYLGFSLANQIIGDLVYLKNITVRPSTSIEKYKDQMIDPMVAANELQVNFLLTGRYILAENKIRSDIELIDVTSSNLIWREPIEVNFQDAFQLQDIVSEKVINGLKIQFSQEERNRIKSNIPQNPLAYEFYLRSLSYNNSDEENVIALELLLKSIEIDSSYAPAFSEIGYRVRVQTQDQLIGTTGLKRAEGYFLKALELNSDHLSSLTELGSMYTELGKPNAAMKYMKRAFEINPNDALAHFRMSYLYRYVGMLEQSEKSAKRALELDPQNYRFRSMGHTLRYLGKYQEALKAYSLDNAPWVDAQKGDVYIKMGNFLLAEEHLEKVIEDTINTFSEFLARGMLAYIKNEFSLGLKVTRRWEEKDIYDSEMIYRLAVNYALLGDTRSAIRVLRKAVEGGFFCYPFFLTDPFLNPVRDDPEFHKVLLLAKEKHEAFKQKYFADE